MKKRVVIKMEFIFRASPTIIYKFLTTPDCLIRWFCDTCEVDEVQALYTFIWDGDEQKAYLTDDWEEELLRFKWEENPEEYFEFRISTSEITGSTIIEITDFCDPEDISTQKTLWQAQMDDLKRAMGEV
jgi:uncharacterized protein YndB with AHSA1/START domain